MGNSLNLKKCFQEPQTKLVKTSSIETRKNSNIWQILFASLISILATTLAAWGFLAKDMVMQQELNPLRQAIVTTQQSLQTIQINVATNLQQTKNIEKQLEKMDDKLSKHLEQHR